MAKKGKDTPKKTRLLDGLKEEVRYTVFAIIFFVFAIFFILASIEKAGVAGSVFFKWFETLLGVGYFMLPLVFFLLSISFFKASRPNFATSTTIGSILFFLSGLGLVDLLGNGTGGIIGGLIATPLQKLFEVYIAFVMLLALLIISLLIIFDTLPRIEQILFWRKFNFFKKKDGADMEDVVINEPEEEVEIPEETQLETEPEEEPQTKEKTTKGLFGSKKKEEKKEEGIFLSEYSSHIEFTPPPLSLLEGDSGKPGVGDIKANANIIKRVLQNFGISVEMDEISIGPAVTRYALKPAEGVKLARIVGLQNELALALSAHPVRIEAPIPGTSLVGIEIPNSTRARVGLRTLFSSDEYQKSQKPLLAALGRGVSGKLHVADIAKMPHLLIAGTTGSGKSVTVHTIINSLLFRNPPEGLRFIMVDPKRVELTLYNGIPHLQTPVITDPKKAILALKWAANEMTRRYDVLEAEQVQNIASYHKNIVEPAYKNRKTKNVDEDDTENDLPERMPYIVIIIDELADIMATYPREMESAIVRLAQMSRAVGIHLILSTQRPSVNIITGLIKANIPARIALHVASQIDSRTILDTGGAEKLLGAGDMLYLSGEISKPSRIQSAFLSEKEVKAVVKYLKDTYAGHLMEEINLTNSEGKDVLFESSFDNNDEGDDDLYEEAREIVIEAKKASTSFLQRKLRIGYSRAARLIDMLEERGIVGPGEGSKPRQVLEQLPEKEENF